ncbi:MAG TPA: hypothetical protein PK280_16330 [Planctomycetota bacterium]|nr:hypothetical protein [Planctomycetota bacterium]
MPQPAVEASVPAAEVKPGTVILRHTAAAPETVSGFYVRLANCLGPEKAPVVAALRAGGELRAERATIPAFPFPLKDYTKTGGAAQPPLDVGQEYRVALSPPLALAAGQTVTVEIVSAGPMAGGVTAGLQFHGAWPLAGMRQPFRAVRGAGPASRVAWSEREVVCTGNQKKFDPECAPQNNSGIIADEDGSLYQFSSFYSVDEQYGGGRGGSFARLYGFRKRPGAKEWEKLGLLVDPTKSGLTYAGDPFAFRDLEGTPHLAYTTADGTNGFSDWKLIDGRLLRSRTRSFAGPWEEAGALYEKFPRGESDDGRMIGIRIYPRPATKDYVLLWQHGGRDMQVRGAVIADLKARLSHEQIRKAAVLARNEEEGGGGFQRGGQGYLSTWQIPWVNDPTALQRLYEFDLADALNPEKWRVVPGSWGWNDGTNAVEDGGCTADAWSLSMVGDDLWATSVVWSVTNGKNSILACRVPWERREGDAFRWGVTRVPAYREVVPVVEYALGEQCSLEFEFTGKGREAWGFLFLAPSVRPGVGGAVGLELSDKGARLAAYSVDGRPSGLTPYREPKWAEAKAFRLKLRRDGAAVTGWVDGVQLGPVTIADPEQRRLLAEPQRFKLYGWQGGLYTVRDAVLTDGPG